MLICGLVAVIPDEAPAVVPSRDRRSRTARPAPGPALSHADAPRATRADPHAEGHDATRKGADPLSNGPDVDCLPRHHEAHHASCARVDAGIHRRFLAVRVGLARPVRAGHHEAVVTMRGEVVAAPEVRGSRMRRWSVGSRRRVGAPRGRDGRHHPRHQQGEELPRPPPDSHVRSTTTISCSPGCEVTEPQRPRRPETVRAGRARYLDVYIRNPGVSRHLRVLREAGLVEVRQEAQRRVYSLQPQPLTETSASMPSTPR